MAVTTSTQNQIKAKHAATPPVGHLLNHFVLVFTREEHGTGAYRNQPAGGGSLVTSSTSASATNNRCMVIV